MRNVLVAMLAFAVLAACGGSDAQSLPEGFLGRWNYAESTGGIDGEGRDVERSGYIVIGADNSLERFDDDGTSLSRYEFTVTFGETIFNDTPMWMIDGDSVLRLRGSTGLVMEDNFPDGFSQRFVRGG